METIITVLLNLLLLYVALGLVFAVVFLRKGATKVDANVTGSSWWFKVLIFPGVCAFWPLLLRQWRKQT